MTERFRPKSLREFAYEDTALPIEAGQTISQPFIVALMIEALELGAQVRKAKEAVVLDVGTGSGHAAAVLAEIAGRVISIERHAALADRAREGPATWARPPGIGRVSAGCASSRWSAHRAGVRKRARCRRSPRGRGGRGLPPERRTGFYGLDLYSLFTSIDAVLGYLDDVDPESAAVARQRYGCLSPWEGDAAAYGGAVLRGRYRACEDEVRAMLEDLLAKRIAELPADGERLQDALQNARLVTHAESYYRTMYYGSAESWNLRDRHMFDVLKTLLDFRGPEARAVVWAHDSHVGDARATEMSARRELNLGQLSRQAWGSRSFDVGFGTDHGSVAAASDWGGAMEIKKVLPSHRDSYEWICHESERTAFLLDLHVGAAESLQEPRLERAIGVVYRPETELASHYMQAILPRQFDEYVWFDETQAVTPLSTIDLEDTPDTYPFGL